MAQSGPELAEYEVADVRRKLSGLGSYREFSSHGLIGIVARRGYQSSWMSSAGGRPKQDELKEVSQESLAS